MKIYSRNKLPVSIINGETRYVEIDELPDNVILRPSYWAVNQGLRIELSGTGQVAIENTHSVIRKLEPNAELGTAFTVTPYKKAVKRAA